GPLHREIIHTEMATYEYCEAHYASVESLASVSGSLADLGYVRRRIDKRHQRQSNCILNCATVFFHHHNGLRSARNLPRSSATLQLLPRGGEAFPHPASYLL